MSRDRDRANIMHDWMHPSLLKGGEKYKKKGTHQYIDSGRYRFFDIFQLSQTCQQLLGDWGESIRSVANDPDLLEVARAGRWWWPTLPDGDVGPFQRVCTCIGVDGKSSVKGGKDTHRQVMRNVSLLTF